MEPIREFQEFNNFYFVGIAGAGMSALALYLKESGKKVSGSDRNFHLENVVGIQKQLQDLGIDCYLQNGEAINKKIDVVIVSTAIEDTIPDVKKARELNLPILKRSELLALIVSTKKTIAVAGTSGKSTTAAMLFHIFEFNGWEPGIITGAGLTSLIKKGEIGNAKLGKGDWLIIEADESDGSLVQYKPEIGLLLNIDKDHQDLDELTNLFITFREHCRTAFSVNHDHPLSAALSENIQNDFGAGTSLEGESFSQEGFSISFKVQEVNFTLNMMGLHNMENALGAVAAANIAGISLEDCAKALKSFEGIYRRHQILGCKNDVWVIDDYAHNPAKCAASIKACAALSNKVIAWFQPHGYKPTKFLKTEFITEIAEALRPNDEIWMSEIYYSGGTAVKDISAAELIDGIKAKGKNAFFVADRNDFLQEVKTHLSKNAVLLLMGARDPSLEEFAGKIYNDL